MRAALAGLKAASGVHWVYESFLPTAAGDYHRSLRARPVNEKSFQTRRRMPDAYSIIVINQAEALYNLGRWRRAEWLMLALMDAGLMSTPIALAGGTAQLAWTYAHTDRAQLAQFLLEGTSADVLPLAYRAEYFFAWALVALRLGQCERALALLAESRTVIVSASSRFNELFLRAQVLAALARFDEAERCCELAAAAPYQGQGVDGLLLWASLRERRGDVSGAREVLQVVLRRDPQAQAAKTAAGLVGAVSDGPRE